MRLIAVTLAVAALGLVGCGDRTPAAGYEGGPCRPNGACDTDLVCLSNVCVYPEGCTPGVTGVCTCGSGQAGQRGCNADRTWGGCVCPCGNGVCDADETHATCPEDCADPCGDGVCAAGETHVTCPDDCADPCGNGVCDPGEDETSCPTDCPVTCGDDFCDVGETVSNCPADCKDVVQDAFVQTLNNKADILFMIDNSNSMEPKQASLKQYFPNFMQPLKDLPTKPDLHIGIVTSDLGAGQLTPPSCGTIFGDQGMLQNSPLGPTCTAAYLVDSSDRFLTYAPDDTGGAVTNFVGDIADAFACYASVGTGGCGFEHQLASVRAALDGCNGAAGCAQIQNNGFLRRDAYLAVIVLTDEDDCSAPPDSTLFDPTQTTLGSELGPMTSYRCFQFGNLCGGVDPGRSQGQRQSCVPGTFQPDKPQHQLIPTQEIAAFLKGLKPQDPRMVYLSVIAGPPAPIAVGLDANGYPDLQPACTGGMGSADPATRLTELASRFDADRASYNSLCQPDLKVAMEQIAGELAQILGRQCLSAPLRDKETGTAGLQPYCVVRDRTYLSGGTFEETAVPACAQVMCDPATAPGNDCKCQTHAGASTSSPCWYIWPDTATCPMYDAAQPTLVGSGYQVWIDRGTDAACNGPMPPAGTYAVIQCSSCLADPSANSYDCTPGCGEYWPGCCPTASGGCYP